MSCDRGYKNTKTYIALVFHFPNGFLEHKSIPGPVSYVSNHINTFLAHLLLTTLGLHNYTSFAL